MTTPSDDHVRHSRAEHASLITDPEEKARREAANALRQVERVRDIIIDALHGDRPFRLRPSMLLDLNRCAIDGLDAYAGNWRPAGIGIERSKHEPPGAHLVPELIEDMCDYVNDNWEEKSPVHLSAFVMWRINWIHPFTDGNGRTARAASYVVLCIRSGVLLPGVKTIPEQIVDNRKPYYDCLEASDTRYEECGLCETIVSELEELLNAMLARQLEQIHKSALGSQP